MNTLVNSNLVPSSNNSNSSLLPTRFDSWRDELMCDVCLTNPTYEADVMVIKPEEV